MCRGRGGELVWRKSSEQCGKELCPVLLGVEENYARRLVITLISAGLGAAKM